MSTSRPRQRYEGSCHCGAVKFAITTNFPELTTCDCSICVRKNAVMVKVHETDFELIAGEGTLSEYKFHTMTARHFFCSNCGIYPFHRKRVTPGFVGINVFCLDGVDLSNVPVRATVGKGMD
ncbi:MAG: GFA family protein [Erythrobacter sp.]|uniref:GFA family protein n=1 Tax=Erythrobacter sp. TaxID=1042 RepID=UPI003265AAB1